MYTWRDREAVMDLLAALTGNRVNYGLNTVGGVRRDVSPEQIPEILRVVDLLEERTKYYIDLALTEETLAKRLVGGREALQGGRRHARRGRADGAGLGRRSRHAAGRPVRRLRRARRSRSSPTTAATCSAGPSSGSAS